jgi:hypothetical protein
VLEVQTNARARANRYVSNPDLPDNAFIVTCHTLPDGWLRLDQFHESQYSIDFCYCGICSPLIRAALETALDRAVSQIMKGGRSA